MEKVEITANYLSAKFEYLMINDIRNWLLNKQNKTFIKPVKYKEHPTPKIPKCCSQNTKNIDLLNLQLVNNYWLSKLQQYAAKRNINTPKPKTFFPTHIPRITQNFSYQPTKSHP